MYKRRTEGVVAPPETQVLLSIEEAAATMGIGRSLLYQLVMRNEVRSIKVGRMRRIPRVALYEFVERQLALMGSGGYRCQ
jgi:excisionase family DNA binding protein